MTAHQMDIVTLAYSDLRYPCQLKTYLGENALPKIAEIGNLDILRAKLLALFSSIKCPGNLILQTYDLAQNFRQQGVVVMSGFHSPMERETLSILLRGKQGVVLCPARNIGAKMARDAEHAAPIEQGRLLILSPFDDTQTRITAETAVARNRFIAALADVVFVAYAEPGGKLEALCREVIAWGKPVYTFGDAANEKLIKQGACAVHANLPFVVTRRAIIQDRLDGGVLQIGQVENDVLFVPK